MFALYEIERKALANGFGDVVNPKREAKSTNAFGHRNQPGKNLRSIVSKDRIPRNNEGYCTFRMRLGNC